MPEVADIRQSWEKIKPGLAEIKLKCRAEWRLEDVYAKCVAGDWTLFLEEDTDGFLILSQFKEPYRGETVLLVQCAFHRGEIDPFDRYEPWIAGQARRIGARKIQFSSPRKGFRRKGWAVADYVYEREV